MLFKIITLVPTNSTSVCLKIRSAPFQLFVRKFSTILLYLQGYTGVSINNLRDIMVPIVLLSGSESYVVVQFTKV